MSDGDLCPKCDEEFVNCTCHKGNETRNGGGSSSHSNDFYEDGYLYDGWYDPGK